MNSAHLKVLCSRKLTNFFVRLMWLGKRPDVHKVENRSIATPHGEIPIRVYTPAGEGPFPVQVYFHGGGFILLDLNSHDYLCRDLCTHNNCVIVSVDYRLAPEHKFPAATDDCYHATQWVADNIESLNGNADQLFVSGDSAGGNLAAVTALRIRDQGGPSLAGQILIYPVTDYHTPATASYMEKPESRGLSRETMIWFWEHYLNNPAEAEDPYASPLKAESLGNLPNTLVITAQNDPLRDEGENYAKALASAGVNVEHRRYQDAHGFVGVAGPVANYYEAIEQITQWLKNKE